VFVLASFVMRNVPRIARAPVLCGLLLSAPARAQMQEIAPLPEAPAAPPRDAQTAETSRSAGLTPTGSAAPTAPAVQTGSVLLEEFSVDTRDVVLAAARTRTTIQEAPGIVTVITAEELAARGHRTVSEALQMVPGFLGGRIDSNGWFDEGVVRGQPRTLLILLNGINVTDPLRNGLSLDARVPIEAVKRIEVTSGPGGVLWGSNALLGIVNIILKDASDLAGAQVLVGAGHGRADRAAARAGVAYGGTLLDGALELFTAVSLYTDAGDALQTDSTKVLGALPAPEPDSKSLFTLERGLTDFNSRDWWLASTGNARLWGELTLDWLVEFERDHRQIATGGALLEGSRGGAPVTAETVGNDALQTASLSWRRRFADDDIGVATRVYGVRISLDEDPFWAFPPAEVPGLGDGVVIALKGDGIYRVGVNADADVELPLNHHLLFGVEAFRESVTGARRTDTLRAPRVFPDLADPTSADPFAAQGIYPRPGAADARCPPPGPQRVDVRGEVVTARFGADCRFEDALIYDSSRSVGALYVSDDWRPVRAVALQPGFRVQLSDTYDPVGLVSGALVWNLLDDVYLKLNYAEGFRPPELQATRVNDRAVGTVGFEGNPGLDVERSRATEAEVNAVLFAGRGPVQRLYVRADYAYSVLSDLVRNVSGRFTNSGERGIHAVEALARLNLVGAHELWLGGAFNRAEDSEQGPIRNFPNVTFTGGVKVEVLPRALELVTGFTWLGPQEDLNRDPRAGLDVGEGLRIVDAADIVVDRIDSALLLRAGVRAPRLWSDRLELSLFAYDLLDTQRPDPDFYFEDRVQSRPQPKGGFTVFGRAVARF